MYRHEYKTTINEQEVELLRRRLVHIMRRDSHADKNGGYFIRSLYFDDHKQNAYFEKLEGLNEREKWRLRQYNLEGIVRLERKEKKSSYVRKDGVVLTNEELQAILSGQSTKLISSDKPLLRRFELARRLQLLKPVQLVDYYREAFVLRTGNVRITFDRNLRAPLTMDNCFTSGFTAADVTIDRPAIAPLEHGLTILEVKYDGYLPAHIGQLAILDGRTKLANSKFILCCQAAQRVAQNYVS